MQKTASYSISRKRATVLALVIGILIGVVNAVFRPIEFELSFTFFGWVAAAVIATVLVHEGIHGLVAVVAGHRPQFGLKLPLVYVTFDTKIPRRAFILVAAAPLILLDAVFIVLFAAGILPVFSYFVIVINTIGAIGDMWIVWKLLPHRGAMVQDTKSGIEVWEEKERK
jgi:hypothetical protein